jgi:hypothetical protein
MGNFSVIGDLPKMYEHCKTTEDKDMTALDFVTDHLINIDSLFDKHKNGDGQKPHKSIDLTIHHTSNQIFQEIKNIEFKSIKISISNTVLIPDYENSIYSHNPIFSIFRPPIFI